MTINQMKGYTWKWYRWLVEMNTVWIAIAVIIIAVTFSFLRGTEQSFNMMGYWLQFSGMILTIDGLCHVSRHFGKKTPWNIFLEWLGRAPWKNSTIEYTGIGTLPLGIAINGKGRIGECKEFQSNESVKKKLEILSNNMALLNKRVDSHEGLIIEVSEKQDRYKRKADNEIENVASSIQSDRKELHTKDLKWSFVGLVWIVTGMTLAIVGPLLYL